MRFWELREKEIYTSGGYADDYTLKGKGLWNITEQTYSCLSMNNIMDMDFEEKIECVDFQTAMKHMVNGGKAQFNCMARMEFRDSKLGYLITTLEEWKDAVLYKEMITEKKWVLL